MSCSLAAVENETTSIMDLPSSVMFHVFQYLDADSLRRATEVCKAFRCIASDDRLWRGLALQRWPEQLVTPSTYKGSHKALVLDHNFKNVVEATNLSGSSCCYSYNSSVYYFECKLLSLEVCTRAGHEYLRLYIDARGERDLRLAHSSCMLVLNDEPASNSTADWHAVTRASIPCNRHLYFDVQPGHNKGCLEWSADAYNSLMGALQGGNCRLCFIYANDPIRRQYVVDYTFVQLLQLLPGQDFQSAWKQVARYEAKGGLMQQLLEESDADERTRWGPVLQAANSPTAPAAVEVRRASWWKPTQKLPHMPQWVSSAEPTAPLMLLAQPWQWEDEAEPDADAQEPGDWWPGAGMAEALEGVMAAAHPAPVPHDAAALDPELELQAAVVPDAQQPALLPHVVVEDVSDQ